MTYKHKHKSVYHMFIDKVERFGDRTFLRRKVDGRWVPITWNELREIADAVARGLIELGLEDGRAAGILSESRVEWIFADLGIISTGGVTTAAYPTSPPSDVAYLLGHAETGIVFAEDSEQLAKIIEKLDELPALDHIIVFDMENVEPHDKVMSFESLLELGRNAGEATIAERSRRLDALDPEHLLTFIYTSGTTGPPKGAMLTHGNALYISDVALDLNVVSPDDESLSFLPLAHALERMIFYMSMNVAGVVNFAESIYSLADNLPEVRPTILIGVPRVYEKIYEKVMARIEGESGMKKKIFAWALETGREHFEYECRGRSAPPGLALKKKLADILVFDKLREVTGGRIRWVGSGGAPMPVEVQSFFCAAGMPMIQAYGLTETSAPAVVIPPDRIRIGRVGLLMPHCDVRIADDGEIMIKGPNVFKGYFKNPEATEESFRDGWFLSGDTGEFDDEGYLMVTGRKKDLLITAGGKNITPQKLEQVFCSIPLISQAVITGDGKKYLTALFTISAEELEAFAKDHHLEPVDGKPLDYHPVVVKTIRKAVEEKNSSLPHYETIKDFRIVDHEFTVESGELTPTMKVKKKIVFEKYRDLIDEMYGGG